MNPAGAQGLEGCSDAELGLGSNSAVTCPDGSKIGTVTVRTPLLDESLEGDLLLRDPQSTDPASGDMFRMAIVVESKERGLLVKLPGSAVADPDTAASGSGAVRTAS